MECLNGSSLRNLGWEHSPIFNWNAHADRLHLETRKLGFLSCASASFPWSGKIRVSTYPINRIFGGQSSSWRVFAAHVGLDGDPSSLSHGDQLSNIDEHAQKDDDASDGVLPKKLGPDELKLLLVDSERAKLIRKLSEANQYNRFLKRQLQINDTALVDIKDKLASLESELQVLVALADEIADSGVQPGTRKISGKYIHSHLVSRLEAMHEKIKNGLTAVDSVKVEEIFLYWIGMAESVQVMGSFDGWSRGEEMSPEYNGAYALFSAALKLRPGRYEIKFLVDGEWQLSPELPTVGEGLLKNNLLIV
ncbi:Immunoglobulin E-set-containing protein [Dioscorea alata]|uniref:Immunoglobulin E-set-containing protein n=2 Tax=Dioscorea alata TaxID=55571 RepID=A0ACB7UDN9_DIOAL|nr:Immunoglobulin E-set-containing protein [Dioscorea alata]KAH7658389.1 Immunoglobulin E-set-containing protein [Dioscorea alata]